MTFFSKGKSWSHFFFSFPSSVVQRDGLVDENGCMDMVLIVRNKWSCFFHVKELVLSFEGGFVMVS